MKWAMLKKKHLLILLVSVVVEGRLVAFPPLVAVEEVQSVD
jgi:hypothetical protein